MNKENNTPLVDFTSDEAIDAIYAISGTEREPFAYNKVGQYGFINPGTKAWPSIYEKLVRKTRTKDDIKHHSAKNKILDRFSGHEEDLFDILSDWSRFAIIIPDYKSAPKTIAQFLNKFGGEVDIHTNPDYEAIHLHTSYKNVNLEFQFHTEECAELKQATDAFYHSYKDIPIEKNSQIEDEYNRQRHEIIKYCQIIYGHSDFIENLFKVQNVIDTYKFQQLENMQNKAEPKQEKKLSNFVMYAKKAEIVQKELANFLPNFLKQLNKPDNEREGIKSIHKKEEGRTL